MARAPHRFGPRLNPDHNVLRNTSSTRLSHYNIPRRPARIRTRYPRIPNPLKSGSSSTMAGSKIRSQPSYYPPLPFHVIRTCSLISSLVVAAILSFFVYHLRHDKFKIPWTFLVVSSRFLKWFFTSNSCTSFLELRSLHSLVYQSHWLYTCAMCCHQFSILSSTLYCSLCGSWAFPCWAGTCRAH